jgi:hypothetical protein
LTSSSTIKPLGGFLVNAEVMIVYYESMKRNLIQNLYMSVGVMEDYKLRDLLASHTLGLVVELEHLKIKTRLTNEKFASVKGEYEI